MKMPKELLPEEELAQYRREKEKIRRLIGQIGGQKSSKQDKIINFVFIGMLAVLFGFDAMREIFHIAIPLPSLFSIEVGISLVSIKIILMIARQARIEHFQFWMLNSIEFRLNNISNEISAIRKNLDYPDPDKSESKS